MTTCATHRGAVVIPRDDFSIAAHKDEVCTKQPEPTNFYHTTARSDQHNNGSATGRRLEDTILEPCPTTQPHAHNPNMVAERAHENGTQLQTCPVEGHDSWDKRSTTQRPMNGSRISAYART